MQDIRERGIELRNKRLELDQLGQTERERRRPELTQPGHGPELELTQLEEIMRRIENIRERGIEQLEKRLELEQVMRKEQEGQQPELRQPEHGPELAQQPTQQRELAQQQPTELERWWKQELQDSRKRRERELELEQPPMELERELEQWWEQAIQDYKKMREREP
jgi:hypothetical protein